MPIEQALSELKKYTTELISIGDAKEYIKNNKQDFMNKLTKIIQYYSYITKTQGDAWIEATDIISDIGIDNPSLEEYVEIIVNSAYDKKESVDPASISGPIESFVNEVRNMQYMDEKQVEEIKYQLQKYQRELINHKELFSEGAYQSLMNDINGSLNKINAFNNMLNSETMQSIRR